MEKGKKDKKFKILAAGDIHGESGIAKKLANKAEREKVDLVILCGDITSPLETKNFLRPFKDKKQKVLILHGNHESIATTDFLTQLYGTGQLHGYSFNYEGIGIFGAGGAVEFNTSEKEIAETLRKGHSGIKNLKKKIMVTHMHAKGTKSEFSGFEGSKSIKEAIKKFKPDFFIHAHIHEGEGLEDRIGKTKILNVGRNGKIIEI